MKCSTRSSSGRGSVSPRIKVAAGVALQVVVIPVKGAAVVVVSAVVGACYQ